MNPVPSVGKKASDPLMTRASIEPMMTTKTASNAVFSASERLLLSRTIVRAAMKTTTPRTETCGNVNCFGSTPIPSNVWNNCENVFISEGSTAWQHFQASSSRNGGRNGG